MIGIITTVLFLIFVTISLRMSQQRFSILGDDDDDGRWFSDEDDPVGATMSILYRGQIISHHGPAACDGWPCCIHNPSDHVMRTWELHLDTDGPMPLMFRMCKHGIAHVDPDTMEWAMRTTPWRVVVDDDVCDECCGGICAHYS